MFGGNQSSPLLAQDESDSTPTLGGGNMGGDHYTGGPSMMIGNGAFSTDIEEQSPLERLIAQSTFEQRGNFVHHGDINAMRDSSAFQFGGTTTGMKFPYNNNSNVSLVGPMAVQPPKRSFLTLFAATCCLLQVGFVWSSFMSPSWFDTHLRFSGSLPVVNKDTNDKLLRSTSLASLLSDLNGADEGMAAMFLILTAFILPCLFFVLGPIWTFQDRTEQDAMLSTSLTLASMARWRRQHNNTSWCSPRRLLEYIMRLSMVIFFFLCTMDIGTSSIVTNNNNTIITVNNQMQGGLAFYTIGMTCALVVIVVLRIGDFEFRERCWSLLQSNDDLRRSVPPNQAFQLPWNIVSSEQPYANMSTEQQEAQQGLKAPLLSSRNVDGHSFHPDDVVSSMQIEAIASFREDEDQSTQPNLCCWKRVVLYEFGVFSTILWIPALFMPLFEVSYGGIISEFISEVSFSIRFWEFPAVLWQRGDDAGTQPLVLILLGMILVGLVYIIPLLATLLALGCWTLDIVPSNFCKEILFAIQPCSCGIIVCIAIHIAVPSFEAISKYTMDVGSSGLCKQFEIFTSDTCLTIIGEAKPGLWFLLAQSLSLEIFVALTVLWKQSWKPSSHGPS